jgi:Na+/phosphate symporter
MIRGGCCGFSIKVLFHDAARVEDVRRLKIFLKQKAGDPEGEKTNNPLGRGKMDNEIKGKMILVCQSLMRMLGLAFEGFRRPTERFFEEEEEFEDKIYEYSSELISFIISKSPLREKEKERVKPYLSIASSLGRLTYNIQGTLDRVRGKSENHILFSDQADKEVNDVFQKAIRLLENLPNLLATESKSLAQRIGEEGRSMLKIADAYSEDHEERLINGICAPKHSPLYLSLIESLKGVMVHTLAVSGKIVSLSSKS